MGHDEELELLNHCKRQFEWYLFLHVGQVLEGNERSFIWMILLNGNGLATVALRRIAWRLTNSTVKESKRERITISG